jgi:hypothetical protein
MANDVLSDTAVAVNDAVTKWTKTRKDCRERIDVIREALAAVQAQPVSHAPLHKMSCLSMKGSRLNGDPFPCDCPASEAQPVSARPDEHAAILRIIERFPPEPVDPELSAVDYLDAKVAELLRLASVSPLRDETREPDTAGRVDLEKVVAGLRLQPHATVLDANAFIDGHNSAIDEVLGVLQRARESAQGETK